ncbi:hypothetical protein POM88_052457 [Heracleum sosnowskyi]|uniref:Uncharacterized protein n=1 Tax=Heracleum sosnowskyi TaxID=360622 RepID=A0AAD8GS14_9APIA|nr:hypothetical protein POM88_052457 [Heracleum sosnowskyi]
MEKAVHSRPVSEEDEAFSSGKKLRLEASPGPQDIEKYTIFTDSEYKLPLYLSEFALSVYNSEKETSYEKVNVVKTMKSLDVVEGTTYLVSESKEEGSEQKVSESKEEGSEEEVFESDEEDSEEELYDESDEEDNEEKLSESDEKDTDEKFGRRKTVVITGEAFQ